MLKHDQNALIYIRSHFNAEEGYSILTETSTKVFKSVTTKFFLLINLLISQVHLSDLTNHDMIVLEQKYTPNNISC